MKDNIKGLEIVNSLMYKDLRQQPNTAKSIS